MPNRQLVGPEGYRYGYQGDFAETDPETRKSKSFKIISPFQSLPHISTYFPATSL